MEKQEVKEDQNNRLEVYYHKNNQIKRCLLLKKMEERIKDYLIFFLAKQKRLIRLLQLTKDSNSEIVQELRKEVREYVNETEKYIAEIEMENLNLSLTVSKFDDYVNCEQKKLDEKFKRNKNLINSLVELIRSK